MARSHSVAAAVDWSGAQAAVECGEAPAFLAAVREELLTGRVHFGVLHSDLHAECLVEVVIPPLQPPYAYKLHASFQYLPLLSYSPRTLC